MRNVAAYLVVVGIAAILRGVVALETWLFHHAAWYWREKVRLKTHKNKESQLWKT